jgi:lipid-A-disaccharide synthase-like uncharacterized protein
MTAMKLSLALASFTPWMVFGFLGQLLFSGRWLVQWLISEKAGRSVVPTLFWYLSLVGGLILLAYSLHLRDPVFILGNSINSVIYLRNLFLIYREQRSATPVATN